MKKKNYRAGLAVFALTLLVFVVVAINAQFFPSKAPPEIQKIKGMVFELTIPDNTPKTDNVYVYFSDSKPHKMEKIADFTYRINLSKDELGPEDNNIIKYRYTRNEYDFHTAEYLEPDNNDYFWREKGRRITYIEGKTQKDIVKRWRWFPEGGAEIVRTSSIKPSADFLPRVKNEDFLSGQVIEDFFDAGFAEHFAVTAEHMKNVGYNFAEIDPPWQWTEEHGLPKVANRFKDNPNYPDDETLRQEILAYKNKGLKVVLAPQLCCDELNTKGKSKAWWDAYFAQTTKFLVHHARIAEETGVDYMHYAIGPEYEGSNYTLRWSNVFTAIRKVYNGKVGEMVWNFGSSPGEIIPDADYIKWGNSLDYFYVAIDTPISAKSNPTNDELKLGATKMLDGVKQLYDRYKKPVLVRTTYFNIKETWLGNTFYGISDVPWLSEPEAKIKKTKYAQNTEDLARTVNAHFRAIAERPWIFGYTQFGYAHWENPLATELSVRGKPAEDVWGKWNDLIFSNGKFSQ